MKQFFILGNPRSGTSLLRIILNSHSKIVVPPESGFLQWWYAKYSNWDHHKTERDYIQFVDDLLTSKKIEGWNLDRDLLLKYLLEKKAVSYGDLISCTYIFYGRRKNMAIWGDKNNYYIHHIPLLKSLYPKAKFIHLVRDGRDVACSYMELSKKVDIDALYRPNLPVDIQAIAEEWSKNNQKVSEELAETNSIVVKFENIIQNMQEEVTRILNYLGLSWEGQLLDYPSYNDEPKETLLWKKKTHLLPQLDSIGRYKQELSNSQIQVFRDIARQQLKKFGYEEV